MYTYVVEVPTTVVQLLSMSYVCIFLHNSHSLHLDVTDLHVFITHPNGTPTAGQIYYLTCSVQLPPHLLVEASIVWTKLESISQFDSSQQLNFNPLRTSDSGQYTCTMTIDTDEVSISGENKTNLMVTSK